MALTKEERSQRAKQRIQERRKEREEKERKYPSARLGRWKDNYEDFFQVSLDCDSPSDLTVRYTGLDNLRALASLISTLVARYNLRIKDLNHVVEATPPMDPAKTFKPNGAEIDSRSVPNPYEPV